MGHQKHNIAFFCSVNILSFHAVLAWSMGPFSVAKKMPKSSARGFRWKEKLFCYRRSVLKAHWSGWVLFSVLEAKGIKLVLIAQKHPGELPQHTSDKIKLFSAKLILSWRIYFRNKIYCSRRHKSGPIWIIIGTRRAPCEVHYKHSSVTVGLPAQVDTFEAAQSSVKLLFSSKLFSDN